MEVHIPIGLAIRCGTIRQCGILVRLVMDREFTLDLVDIHPFTDFHRLVFQDGFLVELIAVTLICTANMEDIITTILVAAVIFLQTGAHLWEQPTGILYQM